MGDIYVVIWYERPLWTEVIYMILMINIAFARLMAGIWICSTGCARWQHNSSYIFSEIVMYVMSIIIIKAFRKPSLLQNLKPIHPHNNPNPIINHNQQSIGVQYTLFRNALCPPGWISAPDARADHPCPNFHNTKTYCRRRYGWKDRNVNRKLTPSDSPILTPLSF